MNAVIDIETLLKRATVALTDGGVESASREARLLLQYAAAIPISTQIAFAERKIDDEAVTAFEAVLARRLRREPLSHILGYREFWSLQFQVTADTLDPRPDSETLIQSVLREIQQREWLCRESEVKLIDFGTGSGCLILALLSELPKAEGLGVDLNPGAVAVASANATRLKLSSRVRFQKGNWDHDLGSREMEAFDIVISNPPYIPTADIADLQPEVAKFEPRLALDGGEDGLTAYRSLALAIQRVMKPDGFAAIEIGLGQRVDVVAIMRESGLRHHSTVRDLQDHERVLIFRKL